MRKQAHRPPAATPLLSQPLCCWLLLPHAPAGYEARPTGLQLLFYRVALVGITIASRLVRAPAGRRTAPT